MKALEVLTESHGGKLLRKNEERYPTSRLEAVFGKGKLGARVGFDLGPSRVGPQTSRPLGASF